MTTLSRTRNYVSRMYSGPRLTTMVLLLGVVGLMMYNAGDPSNWKWLEDLAPEPAAATAQSLPPAEKKKGPSTRYDATSKDYDPTTVKIDDPTNANFHWDEDPDEKDELAKEFQVVTDGSTEIQPEEMFGYSRLLRWVNTRAYQDLLKSSHAVWTFNDLQQTPKEHRGKLLKLPLTVVRILPYDFTDPTTKEQRRIYEVWGWSAKSSSWLYVAIVPELPQGMPPW